MKLFRLFRTWIVIAVALILAIFTFVNLEDGEDKNITVNVEKRLYEFVESSDYDKENISEIDYFDTESAIRVKINDDIEFYQTDRGSTGKEEVIDTRISAPDEENYISDFLTLVELSMKTEYNTFDLESILIDILNQNPQYSFERYFNENVFIIVERLDKKIYLKVSQNHGESRKETAKEDYHVTERLAPWNRFLHRRDPKIMTSLTISGFIKIRPQMVDSDNHGGNIVNLPGKR